MKPIRLLSTFIFVALLAAACGGSPTATTIPATVARPTVAPAAATVMATTAATTAAATAPSTSATMAATTSANATSSATMAATTSATTAANATSGVMMVATTSATNAATTSANATSGATMAATAAGTSVVLSQFQATDPGADISVDPARPTAAATQIVLNGTPDSKPIDGSGLKGTPGSATAIPVVPPKVTPPATLEDLLKQFPELKPYVNSSQTIDNMDMSDLYKKMVAIYDKDGASGLATFLKDSGLLEKFNLPASYLDLLVAYDKGGLDAVKKLASDRGLISSKGEIVAFVVMTSPSNLDQVTADMKKLGVSTYPPLDAQGQLQIGIPLDVLSNYQSPSTLIQYLTKIAHVTNVAEVHPPVPRLPTGKIDLIYFVGTGPKAVGATAWQKAGFTGKGVRVGILDMGFGGIKKLMDGKNLPKTVKTSIPLDELDAQTENHGTACAEVVHGAAPDAELYIGFFDDNASWNDAVDFLVKSQVQIISYSIGSAVGPHDGTFGEALFVDEFVQKTGILWVNAAGNEAVDHTTFKYNDTAGDGQHHFDDKNDSLPFVAFDPHTNVVMNWNGNWNGGEKNEYTFSILDKSGNEVASAAEPKKGRKNDYPFQMVTFDATPEEVYYMVIKKSAKAKGDATMDIFINNGLLPEWARVPEHSITTPADSNAALSVGATGLTKDKIEIYSSQGPTNDDRVKPDLTAPTGEVLPNEPDGFNGTSGATPLISGVAALVLQAYPKLTAPELKAFLMTNVKDLGAPGPDSVFGTGRIKLPDPATVNSDQGPDTNPTASPDNNGGDTNATAAPTPAKKPTKAPASNKPVATITKTDVKFNVAVKGVKGVKISVSFEVDNFKGKDGIVALQIFQSDGKTPVTPKTKDYTIGKTIGTGGKFTAQYDQTAFNDLPMFLPNSEFTNLKSGKNDLVYVITIIDYSDQQNPTLLLQSDPTPITITKK